jgi:prepilin-type N-terminal cleavage/methylation domain-containing protein
MMSDAQLSGELHRPTAVAARGFHQGREGFTLIEVLVALVIGTLLGGALISLLAGQSLFYAKSDQTISAERNIRAAAEMISTEVRMAAPEDLVAATPDSISLRYDVLRGVVCDSTAPDEVAGFVLDTVGAFGLSTAVEGWADSEPYDSAFVYADGFSGTVTSIGSGPKTVCTDNGAPSTLPSAYYRTVSGWHAQFGDLPDRGSYVRVYKLLTYRFAPSVFASGRTLWRGSEELVGPFADSASFSYVMADGGVQTTVSGSSLDSVRALRVSGTTVDEDTRFDIERSFNFDVVLRN